VAITGQRTAVPFEVGRAHVIQHQGALAQVAAGQGRFDLRLLQTIVIVTRLMTHGSEGLRRNEEAEFGYEASGKPAVVLPYGIGA
jgi:hypothetical protein